MSFRVVFFTLFALLFIHSPAVPLEWVAWSSRPKVALTFDDGPHPQPTVLLCEVLARYRVPATFFIVGRVAVKYPELLKELVRRGHELANHTWNHLDIRLLSPMAMRLDLDRTRRLIGSITGKQTYLFRTPGGTENYIRQSFRIPSGYKLVLWDVHSRDQEGLSSQEIADRVLSQVHNGDVILMHNGLVSTREALEIIIPTLQKRGYEFLTISDLMKTRTNTQAWSQNPTFVQG